MTAHEHAPHHEQEHQSLLQRAKGLAEVGFQERTYYDHRIARVGSDRKTTWHSFVTLSPGEAVAADVPALSLHHGVADLDGKLLYSVAVEERTRPNGIYDRTEVYLFQSPEDHAALQGMLAIPPQERYKGNDRVAAYRSVSPAAYQAAVEMGFVHKAPTTDME